MVFDHTFVEQTQAQLIIGRDMVAHHALGKDGFTEALLDVFAEPEDDSVRFGSGVGVLIVLGAVAGVVAVGDDIAIWLHARRDKYRKALDAVHVTGRVELG